MLRMFGHFIDGNNTGVRRMASQLGKQLVHTVTEKPKLAEKYPNELTNEMLSAFEQARATTVGISQGTLSSSTINPAVLARYPNEISKKALDDGLKQAETLRKKSSVY